jgi:hypothetical protein
MDGDGKKPLRIVITELSSFIRLKVMNIHSNNSI